MTNKKQNVGRPKKPPSVLIKVPVSKIKAVEKVLKKEIDTKQEPAIMVRVPKSLVPVVRQQLKKGK